MSRVVALVEGRTEQTFVREMLAPHLGTVGVFLTAKLVGKPGHKGGVGEYVRAKRDLLALLKQEPDTFCTTMFDYYGMPQSWPGRSTARDITFEQRAPAVEQALASDIAQTLGTSFNPQRFIPYVQMHEFEALLFSQPEVLDTVIDVPAIGSQLRSVANHFRSPEEINDNPNTCPSRRIISLCENYRKAIHGIIAAQRIGLDEMRARCRHFNSWIKRLEGLGPDNVVAQ